MFRYLVGYLACSVLASTAMAQDLEVRSELKAKPQLEQPKQSGAQAPNKNVERIEVTGSYIKRIDVEGPSPMVTIDSEMFEKTGTNTVNDLLRENPLFESSVDEGSRSGYFRFHGQHAGNTLVLLNGLRIPKMGAPGRDFFNGVRGIPSNVIDKVDILKDGSSALYGSDAMAGVINFVTKKDYDGAEFSLQTTVPEVGVGLEQNISATFGKNFSRGNWLTSLQYVQQDAYTESDLGSFYRGPSAAYGPSTFKLKGINPDGSTGKTILQKRADCNGQDNCQVNHFDITRVRTPKQNMAALITGRYDINSDVNVSVLAMYNRRQKQYKQRSQIFINPQSPGLSSLQLGKIKNSPLAKSLSDQNASSGLAALEGFEAGNALGFQESNLVEDSYTLQSRVQGYFADSWSWSLEGTAGFQTETTRFTNGIVDTGEFVAGLNNGSIDPSNPSASSLNSARRNPREEYQSSMIASRLFASGELGDFNSIWGAGGPLALAIGADVQFEASSDNNDPSLSSGILNINRPINLQGSRQVQSVFTELSAYPLDSVELQLAGRYDNYSDFGDTFNPKFALAYRPSKTVLFRSSWGTNFHAPSVRNLITPETISFERFRDETKCKNVVDCDESREFYQTVRYRSPDLGPETSIHYNFGTVIQPNRNWTFTIDQWNFKGKNTIAKLFGDQYTTFANIISPEDFAALGATMERDAEGNLVSLRVPEIVNMGQRTIRGLDLKIDFDQKVQVAGLPLNLNLSTNHSHFLTYSTRRSPLLPVENRDNLGWKNTSALSVRSGGHSYRLAARTTAGESYLGSPAIPTWTEYDFTYGVSLPWKGRLSFGVKNIVNSRPPVDVSNNNVAFSDSNSAFSPLRRRYFVGYSQSL